MLTGKKNMLLEFCLNYMGNGGGGGKMKKTLWPIDVITSKYLFYFN